MSKGGPVDEIGFLPIDPKGRRRDTGNLHWLSLMNAGAVQTAREGNRSFPYDWQWRTTR